MLTLELAREHVPPGSRSLVTEEVVDCLNRLSENPEEARLLRDNFITYARVLKEGRYRVLDYTNAVAYVSFKMMGLSNQESYRKTFPDRWARMENEGLSKQQISSLVSAYNKNQLVNLVYERVMVPSWILNQDMFQEALNTQYLLMSDPSQSGKVRCEAANSILTHLKRPETIKGELKIDIGLNDGMQALQEQLRRMAELQQKTIEGRVLSAKEVAALPMDG